MRIIPEPGLSPELKELAAKAIPLLQQLIAIPSLSKEEAGTADLLHRYFEDNGISVCRKANNLWVQNAYFDSSKPVILLNSHHDTVKPVSGWTREPYNPVVEDAKLYGLGSNDAGAALVSLLSVFLHYYPQKDLAYNLIFAATAEEEISGKNGIELILPELGAIDFAIVGEPTLMQLAVAEKGLLVLDCVAYGKTGHAARSEGENAIYKALRDIEWFRNFSFPKVSELLGPVHMNVTMIQGGTQHNVIPDRCDFTVDIRMTDAYTHEEILEIIRAHVESELSPRSMRIRPSAIAADHPMVISALRAGCSAYGSPTTSDQALMPFDSVKLGPGDSMRSHTADEYVFTGEIETGIAKYIEILNPLLFI